MASPFASKTDEGGRTCIFCGAAADLTKEHVFPLWLRDAFSDLKDDEITMTLTSADATGARSVQEWKGDLLATTTRRACAGCNNGWMSSLEGRTRTVLLPMAQGDSRALGVPEQILLATWATKTAMVGEFMPLGVRIFTDEERAVVMAEDRPPWHVQARLAAYDGNGLPLAFYRTVYAASRRQVSVERLVVLTTMVVGCAVFQIYADRGSADQQLTKGPTAGPQHLSLFPPALAEVQWPPIEVLADDTLPAFTEALGPLARPDDRA